MMRRMASAMLETTRVSATPPLADLTQNFALRPLTAAPLSITSRPGKYHPPGRLVVYREAPASPQA